MNQMPTELISPTSPSGQGRSGRSNTPEAGEDAGFDRALQRASEPEPRRSGEEGRGRPPGEEAREGRPREATVSEGTENHSPAPAESGGRGRSGEAGKAAGQGADGESAAQAAGGKGESGGKAAEARLVREQAEAGGEGEQSAAEVRMLAILRQLMERQSAAKDGELAKLAGESRATEAEKLARVGGSGQGWVSTLLAGSANKGQGGANASGQGGGGLLPNGLTGLSLLSGLGGGNQQVGQGQGPGFGSGALAQLLQAQQGGDGTRGGAGQGAGAQSGEGSTRDFASRLAGAEGGARDGAARPDGMNAQSGQAAQRSASSSGPRVVQGAQSVPRAMVQVAQEAADGQRDVRLKLNPPSLGNVRVELQMADQRIQAVFHMDSRQAASLLDGQMQTLRNALQDHQLELEDVQVQVANSGAEDGQGEPWDQDPQERRGGWAAWGGEEGGDGEAESAAPGPVLTGGLSLYA